MSKYVAALFALVGMIYSSSILSFAEINLSNAKELDENIVLEIAKGRLFVGMTKVEAFEAEGTPYRVKRLEGEDNKEMWIYRCMNGDGFNEDCLYLYFNGDELDKIERP